RADWDVGDTGTWIQDTFNFGFVNYTLGPGKAVGFKVMVGAASGGDMWFAYDTTTYPAWGQLVILAPGISVNPISGLTTTEGGGTATFTVVLDSAPSANVTIGLSSNDLTEGTVAPASVTVPTGNGRTAQTVTVAATSTDGSYNGMNAPDVGVANTDDDTAGISVIPTSGLTTTEGGGTATFTVALTSQPTANVTIGLSSSDLTEGTVAPASLTFTSGNWNTAQTVTVTGVDDFGVDGPVAYTIVTAAATSTDPDYSGMNAVDVGVTNT